MEFGPFVLTHAPLRMIPSRIRAIVRDERALRRAVKTVPRPVPWDWARPRLMPLLGGTHLDRVDDGLVRTISEMGCALEYGLDLGGTFSVVDAVVAERWERSADDLHSAAMENLRRRASRILPKAVIGGTVGGRYFRRVLAPRGCASSLVLVPDELVRLLGPEPTILLAPNRTVLLSFPLRIDVGAAAEIALEFEGMHPYPLMLDPFALEDGRVTWDGDGMDDWAEVSP
jgi:hypothetical protein